MKETYEAKEKYLKNLFAKIAGKRFEGNFLSEKDREEKKVRYGMKKFKWKAMGIRGKSIRTLEEMAELLYETNMVPSIEEGEKVIPSLVGKHLDIPGNSVFTLPPGAYWDGISFIEVANGKGNLRYKVNITHF